VKLKGVHKEKLMHNKNMSCNMRTGVIGLNGNHTMYLQCKRGLSVINNNMIHSFFSNPSNQPYIS